MTDLPMSLGMVKAMSNPIRWHIVAVLNALGAARATDVAAEIGAAPNAVSFHLRTLAEAGIVEEAPELARDGRERWWKLVQQSLDTDQQRLSDDAGYRTATAAGLHMLFEDMMMRVHAALEHDPASETQAMQVSGYSLKLTKAQARAFGRRLWQVVEEFKEDPVAATEAMRPDGEPEGGDGPESLYTGLIALAPLMSDD